MLLENTFYQYLDEEGFFHESLLHPLGSFIIIIDLILVFIFIFKKAWQSFLQKIPIQSNIHIDFCVTKEELLLR
tara:strand:- start:5145 stop:5366 length:222 start_codon:yes stop_codon:yes gene_type:complete